MNKLIVLLMLLGVVANAYTTDGASIADEQTSETQENENAITLEDAKIVELGESFQVNDKCILTITRFELSDDSDPNFDKYDFQYTAEYLSGFLANTQITFVLWSYPEEACLHDNGIKISLSRMASGSQVPSSTMTTTTVFMQKDLKGDVYLTLEDVWVKVK